MNAYRKASIHSLDFQGETLGAGPWEARMLPRSAANATKPVSYRQRGETGHSPARGGPLITDGIQVTDLARAHLPR